MGSNKGKRMESKNSTKKKKKKKNRTGLKVFFVILLILVLGIGAAFAYKTYQNGGGLTGILATLLGHTEETKKNLPEFKVLLLGVSTDIDVELTDTIIAASYNPNTQKATLLSVPRDTFIGKSTKNASGYDKINAVYQTKGAEGVLACVNELTGLDIEYYAVIRTAALRELVDAIGGVKFNVPIDMKYNDPSQDLYIDLKAGEQIIDGAKAEQLLRFRHNDNGTSYSSEYGDNDVGRMRTQREFIAETLRQTLKVENIFKIGQILDIAKQNVQTNVNLDEVKDYIPYLVEFNTENLVSDSLPGKNVQYNSLWFFECDKVATKELVNKLFVQRDAAETTTEDSNETNETNTTSTDTSKSKLSIQIDNKSGSDELYEKAVTALETAGYTVKKANSNASSKKGVNTEATTSTTVISNQKYVDATILNEIKTILGTGTVSNNASSTSTADVRITLGTDYK